MRKTTIGATIASTVAAGLLLTGGVALATSPAGQRTPECGAALSKLVDARADLTAAQKAYDALPKTVPNPDLSGLQGKVDTAVASAIAKGFPVVDQTQAQLARLKGIAAVGDSDSADSQTDAQENAEALPKIAALEAVFSAKSALAAAPATVPNPELKKAKDRLEQAKRHASLKQELADKACKGEDGKPGAPAPTTVTPPPPAATTVAPPPGASTVVVPPVATRIVTGAPQFVAVPNVDKGVNTGDGSLS